MSTGSINVLVSLIHGKKLAQPCINISYKPIDSNSELGLVVISVIGFNALKTPLVKAQSIDRLSLLYSFVCLIN